MEILRIDIVERGGSWLLTDSRDPPRAFLSSSDAVQAARAEARGRTGPTEIYLWRNGTAELVDP